jgi:hypothetical protein
VSPSAPKQNEVGADAHNSAEQQQDTAKELAREFRWVEIGQFVVNGILAVIGIIALCIYGGQLKVMRGQLDEMSASRRPWVGPVGELKMIRPPGFWADERIDWPPEFAKANPGIASTPPLRYVEVYTSWSIQNFGNSPARRVNHTLLAYVSNDANNPTAEVRNMACKVGNQMVANPNVNATVLFPGNVIAFPPTNAIAGVPRDMTDILGVWLVGCVTYEDTAGNIHHTKILWASDLSNAPAREVALENMRLTWLPFKSFRLVESDVDD